MQRAKANNPRLKYNYLLGELDYIINECLSDYPTITQSLICAEYLKFSDNNLLEELKSLNLELPRVMEQTFSKVFRVVDDPVEPIFVRYSHLNKSLVSSSAGVNSGLKAIESTPLVTEAPSPAPSRNSFAGGDELDEADHSVPKSSGDAPNLTAAFAAHPEVNESAEQTVTHSAAENVEISTAAPHTVEEEFGDMPAPPPGFESMIPPKRLNKPVFGERPPVIVANVSEEKIGLVVQPPVEPAIGNLPLDESNVEESAQAEPQPTAETSVFDFSGFGIENFTDDKAEEDEAPEATNENNHVSGSAKDDSDTTLKAANTAPGSGNIGSGNTTPDAQLPEAAVVEDATEKVNKNAEPSAEPAKDKDHFYDSDFEVSTNHTVGEAEGDVEKKSQKEDKEVFDDAGDEGAEEEGNEDAIEPFNVVNGCVVNYKKAAAQREAIIKKVSATIPISSVASKWAKNITDLPAVTILMRRLHKLHPNGCTPSELCLFEESLKEDGSHFALTTSVPALSCLLDIGLLHSEKSGVFTVAPEALDIQLQCLKKNFCSNLYRLLHSHGGEMTIGELAPLLSILVPRTVELDTKCLIRVCNRFPLIFKLQCHESDNYKLANGSICLNKTIPVWMVQFDCDVNEISGMLCDCRKCCPTRCAFYDERGSYRASNGSTASSMTNGDGVGRTIAA